MTWEDDHQRRVAAFPEDIRGAHQHSSNHRAEVLAAALCGCFFCCSTFSPDKICEWTDEGPDGLGQTAICPLCGVDSVLANTSGFDVSPAFLASMKAHWF